MRRTILSCALMLWTLASLAPSNLHAQERNQFLQDPGGDIRFGKIDGGGVYRLSGVARDVTIEEINGRTTVDMSALSAQSITIGLLDGASCVRFKCRGDFAIKKKVDGRSWLAGKAGGNITIGDKIDGRSRAKLKAGGMLRIGDKIDGGPCTAVLYDAPQAVIPYIGGGSRVDRRAIADEDVFNLRTYPFDFRCTSDDANYPTPSMPD